MRESEANLIKKLLLDLNIIDEESIIQYAVKTRDNPNVSVLKCLKSGVIFLNETSHISKEYYADMEHLTYWSSKNFQFARNSTFEDDNRRANSIFPYINNKIWADVGTGVGGILNICKNKAREISAVEPQKHVNEMLKQEGFNTYSNILELQDNYYDVISLFHVFEHIASPLAFLDIIYTKLNKNGLLIIEVPHAKDALLSWYESEAFKEFTLWSEHLVLHTRQSLKKTVEASKFFVKSIEGVQRYSLANHLMWLAKGNPGGHNIWNQLSSQSLNQEYSNVLAKLDITDTLFLIATKNNN